MRWSVLLLLIPTVVFAREWKEIPVEGGYCADGKPYSIFISEIDNTKPLFVLKSGGACWSEKTCYGKPALADIHMKKPFNGGVLSSEKQNSPYYNHTVIYFPYCTGDAFLGNHIAKYGNKETYHYGRWNIVNGLFAAMWELKFSDFEEVTLMGFSAGSLGSLVYVSVFDMLFGYLDKKTLIIDSPGLHFGKNFWGKFTKKLREDYRESLEAVELPMEPLLAKHLKSYCKKFSGWKMKFLQSSKDIVMSVGMGDIDPWSHRRLVYGKKGIYETLKDPTDNCSVWVHDSYEHIFLKDGEGMHTSVAGVTAKRFIMGDGSSCK